nr:hypothetical protein CFP56_48297 [Quercus suber]
MTKNQELSREEEAELSKSKKKVKEGHHVEFNDGLRAYAKAFDFSNLLDMEADSDEEVEELCEGLTAVRLHELPMELYETEALKQIGEAMGRVLWIDSHTAIEARGRYARLCIQLDVTKPLIDTILIGRFERLMVYEGLHKLCFSCGRIEHRKKLCLLTIKKPKSPMKSGSMSVGEDRTLYKGALPHGLHDSSCTGLGSGTVKDRGAGIDEDKYGPWMLVTQRKPGQKKTNFAVTSRDHAMHRLGQAIRVLRQEPKGDTRDWTSIGEGVETVRPLRVVQEPSLGNKMLDKQLEFRFNTSVKGKRELARSRATKGLSKVGTGGVASRQTKMGKQSQRQDFGDSKGRYGESQSEANTHNVMDQSEASARDGG